MSDEPKRKRFSLSKDRTSFTLRDLDNAQPVIPPPRNVHIPHPGLAPPGMSGFRTSARPVLDNRCKEPPRLPGESGHTSRAFKPFARGPKNDRDIDR